MSRFLQPFLVLSVPPPSLCHLWLHWLGGEGLASAPLCLPMPCPASLPTHWGSWGQCCPPSLSINLLGKHSLEWGGLSVCLSVHDGAAHGVSPRHCRLPHAVHFAEVLLLPWAHCLDDGSAGRILPGQAEGPLLPISLGGLVLGFILLLPSLPPELLPLPQTLWSGQAGCGSGQAPLLTCQPCHQLHLLLSFSQPCGSPAPQSVGSVPAMKFLGETKGLLSELGWFYTAWETSRTALLQKVGGYPGPPSLLTSVLIKKAAGTLGELVIIRLPRAGLGEEMRLVVMKH